MSAWRRMALIGLASFSVLGNATAQTKRQERAPTAPALVTASVDAQGRVVPGSPPGEGTVQRIGERTSDVTIESPCAATAALPADEARRLIETTAREEQFEPELVVAVAKAESGFVSTSLSPKGAYGLMQLMPATARVFGVDICDPRDNVRGGIHFLRELTAKYRNPVYVLAAYNAGEPAILKAKGVPPIAETVGYVATVLNDFYGWPTSSASPEAPVAGEPRYALALERQRAARQRAPTRVDAQGWQGGFVQNFD